MQVDVKNLFEGTKAPIVSEELREHISGYKGDLLGDAARAKRLLDLSTPWEYGRKGKSVGEVDAHNGAIVARGVSKGFPSVPQLKEVCHYIQTAIRAIAQGLDVNVELGHAGDYRVDYEKTLALPDPRTGKDRKRDIPVREKAEWDRQETLAMQVIGLWFLAGCPRGLPQEAIDLVTTTVAEWR